MAHDFAIPAGLEVAGKTARVIEALDGQLVTGCVRVMPTVRDGIQVIEVNGVAAWQGLQRVTGFDIAGCIVEDLLDRKLAGGRAAPARLPRQA